MNPALTNAIAASKLNNDSVFIQTETGFVEINAAPNEERPGEIFVRLRPASGTTHEFYWFKATDAEKIELLINAFVEREKAQDTINQIIEDADAFTYLHIDLEG